MIWEAARVSMAVTSAEVERMASLLRFLRNSPCLWP